MKQFLKPSPCLQLYNPESFLLSSCKTVYAMTVNNNLFCLQNHIPVPVYAIFYKLSVNIHDCAIVDGQNSCFIT